MKRITAKLGNMRKAESFIVYPRATNATDDKLTIQSEHRICQFDPATGKGVLSVYRSSGAYFLHLSKALGATEITVPAEVIAAATEGQPKSGDVVGSSPICGVVVVA